jgi:pyruvate/2-oxoglutarate dehydrogenase complex dihydrolipoamide dehydrogenase (E3) component
MKNLILIPMFLFTFLTLALANNDTGNPVTLLNGESMTISIEDTEISTFISAEMTADNNNFEFETNKEIKFVQIYGTDGKISFQLSVGSKKVRINKNLFDKGDYKLGFRVEGDSQLHYANVNLN